MSAPEHAERIGHPNLNIAIQQFQKNNKGNLPPAVQCEACEWHGLVLDLLGVDPDENTTLWCPQCGSSYWVYT